MISQQNSTIRQSAIVPVGLALVALLMGLAIYVLDRPAGSVYLLTHWFAVTDTRAIHTGIPGQYFGILGFYLPTFLHTYAFILLTIVVIAPYQKYRQHILWVAITWLVIESLFEFAQINSIAQTITSWVPTSFSSIPLLENIPNYFTAGAFDVLDMLSILGGAFAAYLTIEFLTRKEYGNETAN